MKLMKFTGLFHFASSDQFKILNKYHKKLSRNFVLVQTEKKRSYRKTAT